MIAGALLSVWASILDGCDGEVARFKLLSSKLGCWLDTICDYLYYLMTFCGIAWGLNRGSGTNIYLAWGAVLACGMLLSFFVVSWFRRRMAAAQPDKFLALFQAKAETRSSNPLLFVARNTEFVIRRCFFPYALLVAALLNLIKPVFIITAISANLVWIIALYSSFALSRNEAGPARIQPRMEPDASLNASS
jgi:CDP-L-myo-inositol myo-inositolphosphotransferase